MARTVGDYNYCSLRSLSRWNVGISFQLWGGERRERGSDFGATVRYDGRCGSRVLAHIVRVQYSESTSYAGDMDPDSQYHRRRM